MRQLSINLLIFIYCCSLSAASIHRSSLQHSSSTRAKITRNCNSLAFVRVPRGGDIDDANTNGENCIVRDLYYQHLSDNIKTSDDVTSEEIDLLENEYEYYDVEASCESLLEDDAASATSRPSHRHQRAERYTTRPTQVVCRGGGMEAHNSSENALLNIARKHNINLPTEDGVLPKKYDSILLNSQTSLSAALQKSNTDARFLICYISKKKKGGPKKSDSIALSSLLSPEVVKLINRRPLGKKQSDSTGSYNVWIMNGDDGAQSKEIDTTMKRLKVKPPTSNSKKSSKKKEDGPILAIFYPATTVDSSGKLKVTPRLLAQHHCHPPPSSPEVMMNWANTIRKRHIREFAKLQHDRKEMQLLKERTEGYKESMKEDKEREEREERELQAKKEAEEKERLRQEKLEERRQELLEALPEEPEAGSEGVITIALRFGDGSRDQRRFLAEETSVNDLFNWVDATHGVEREKIELSTMNGSKTFKYVEEEDENEALDEAGLGKMTALRVTEIVEETDDEEKKEEDEESEDSDDEE